MSRFKSLRKRKRLVPRVEGLENRLAMTSLAIITIDTGRALLGETANSDVVVRVIGEDDKASNPNEGGSDNISLETIESADGDTGNVLVRIDNLDLPGRRLFAAIDVDTQQAIAQSDGGNFLGFKVYGLAGNDTINVKGLKNLERTELNGNDGTDSDLNGVADIRDVFPSLGADPAAGPNAVSDNDTITGGSVSRDRYFGGRGNDTLIGVDIFDTVPAGIPFAFTPYISGGPGDDILRFEPTTGSGGATGVTLNLGNSDLSFSEIYGTSQNDTIDLTGGPNKALVDGGAGDDSITGSTGDDTLRGGPGKDTIRGENGNDVIEGQEGDDTLWGGAGNDTIDGGANNDVLNGEAGDDDLRGGDGDDVLTGGDDNDKLDGGAGDNDTASYRNSPGPVYVSLALGSTLEFESDVINNGNGDGWGNKDTLVNLENVDGSDNNDYIQGDGKANKLNGFAGNDRIRGGAGNDTIKGGVDNDVLDGEGGEDSIEGEAGNDTLFGGDEADVLKGGADNDNMFGERGDDHLEGGDGSDSVNGGLGFDVIEGGTSPFFVDQVYTNYDFGRRALQDYLVTAGPGNPDNFYVATLKYRAPANFAAWAVEEQELDNDNKMDLPRRLDAQAELSLPLSHPDALNGFGARDLIYSDFDGGDGGGGDWLFFENAT